MRIGRCQCGQVGGRVAVAVQLQRLCQCRSEQPAVANTLHAAVLGKLAGVDGFDDPVMQPDWFGAPYLANCRKTSRLDRKSTRLNSVTNAHLVCRLLLEKQKL